CQSYSKYESNDHYQAEIQRVVQARDVTLNVNTNLTTPIKLKSIESFGLESEQYSNLAPKIRHFVFFYYFDISNVISGGKILRYKDCCRLARTHKAYCNVRTCLLVTVSRFGAMIQAGYKCVTIAMRRLREDYERQ
ncbi:hypothetical protein SFRURICE_005586, partial [Spodoptera frugiperda]